MRELIIGTTNPAKIAQIRGALAPLGLEMDGLPTLENLPKIEEDAGTAQGNAKKKALAYAQFLGKPVLSMDNSLYFDELADNEQPGINVRRINGRMDRPTDDEVLQHYSHLIEGLGGETNGRWEFAVCIATSEGDAYETTIVSPRIFVSTASPKVIPGYPLESLQIDSASGKYISEMTQLEQDEFWQRAIGKELCGFVQQFLAKGY